MPSLGLRCVYRGMQGGFCWGGMVERMLSVLLLKCGAWIYRALSLLISMESQHTVRYTQATLLQTPRNSINYFLTDQYNRMNAS